MGDKSVSADSVFDWGMASWSSLRSLTSGDDEGNKFGRKGSKGKSNVSGAKERGNGDEKVTRYDPKAMSRISDIVDELYEESSTDSIDSALELSDHVQVKMGKDKAAKVNGKGQKGSSYGPGGMGSALFCRRTLSITALIAVITAASLVIGYAVVIHDPSTRPYSMSDGDQQQQFLEVAERVISACSEHSLDQDISECQKLCHGKLCCFDSGEYSCNDDEGMECAVYAGCEALVDGVPTDGLEEEEG